jgi:hypothetical protein
MKIPGLRDFDWNQTRPSCFVLVDLLQQADEV